MNALNIIDVSALVYTGNSSKFYLDKTNYGFPVGGLHYLMKQVAVSFITHDAVLLCFDSPSFRKGVMPTYKSGRQHRPEVYSQIEFAYNSLLSCGFHCAKVGGFEADDIVFWAAQMFGDQFYETVIIGNDHDLCHNVRDRVRFKSIAPDSACIFAGNFEESVDSTYTRFNTISAKKCMCGCTSDKVPALHLANGMRGEEIYTNYLQFLEAGGVTFNYKNTADPRYVVAFSKLSGLFTDEEQKEMIKRIKVVFPAGMPNGVTLTPDYATTVNEEKLAKFLTMINDFNSLKCLQYRKATLTEDDKQLLRDLGRSLTTGEFAADRNLPVSSSVPTQTLDLSEFTKEF